MERLYWHKRSKARPERAGLILRASGSRNGQGNRLRRLRNILGRSSSVLVGASASQDHQLSLCPLVATRQPPTFESPLMRSPSPPIPFPDYQRIFRVLKTVVDAADLDAEHASKFFSVAGAIMVEQIYKRRCQPVAGTAFYQLGNANDTVLSFTDPGKDQYSSTSERNFHCWVLCDGYVIDFMAPLFREFVRETGNARNCPRKMFQKPLGTMAESPRLMPAPGDFYMLPDVDLTRATIKEFHESNFLKGLLDVCMQWYRKPPRKIASQLMLETNEGSPVEMRLTGITLTGAW